MELFNHQKKIDFEIDEAYAAGKRAPLVISPTGSGKTVIFANRLNKCRGFSAAIAHRAELVGQMSYALARFGVRHRVIGPKKLIVQINQMHLAKLRKSFYDPQAKCAVVSVQSLTSDKGREVLTPWARNVTEWITDEGHHLLRSNMWGTAVDMFQNARGLGVSAESRRADGAGLGKHADGVYDCLIEGPQMRELINAGFLVDYKLFCPPSDLNMEGVAVGANGEFVQAETRKRVQASHIIGDVVAHYLRIAPGLRGITFAPDVETADDIAARFNAAGVPAASISSYTEGSERIRLLAMFESGQLLQLVNVDLFGEGYDLPALEVVSFARPTASFQLYLQQFGRVLRTNDGKQFGIIIDHVGNCLRHGLPDAYRDQSLDGRERGTRGKPNPDVPPIKRCLNPTCQRAYEAICIACPFCGHKIEPLSRKAAAFVDGDLYELDAETLARMRGDVDRELYEPAIPRGVAAYVEQGIKNAHWEKCQAQDELRQAIALWAGWMLHLGRSQQESFKAFYFRFGMDVLAAQTLPRAESERLTAKVNEHIGKMQKIVDKLVNSAVR